METVKWCHKSCKSLYTSIQEENKECNFIDVCSWACNDTECNYDHMDYEGYYGDKHHEYL